MKLKDVHRDPKVARLFKKVVMSATKYVKAPFKPVDVGNVRDPWHLQSDTGDETIALSVEREGKYVHASLRVPAAEVKESRLTAWLSEVKDWPEYSRLSEGITKSSNYAWWTAAFFPRD